MTANCDIAIIGGGPVGAALALALRDSNFNITLLEARSSKDEHADPRALALSYGSRLLLARLGVWQDLSQVSRIKTIHISQKNSFGRTQLSAAELNVPDLGYVLPYPALQAALQSALRTCTINYQYGASVTQLHSSAEGASVSYQQDGVEQQLNARLVVVADGGTVAAEHGIGKLKRKWLSLQMSAVQVRAMRAVKNELDPAGILAPGNVL